MRGSNIVPTVTTRTVQLSVKAPTLEDVIVSVIGPIQGTGNEITFTLPEGLEDGAQIMIFVRLEKTGSSIEIGDTGGFVNTAGGLYSYWTNVDEFGIEGVRLVSLARYASSSDSGTSYTLHVTLDDGSAEYVSSFTLMGVVMKANPLVNYTDYANGVQWTHPYGMYQSMSIDATHYNSLFLFAAVGYTAGNLGFNAFPTQISTTSNMYLGAKIYKTPISFDTDGISVITSVPFFVGVALWMISQTATS